MRHQLANRRIQISLLILYLTPIVLLIGFIAEFRVNVPSWDEWPVSMIFQKAATGELSFSDFIEPYNQHRYLFLRLIIVPLAFLTDWNKDYELACNFILALLTWLMTVQIFRNTAYSNSRIPWVIVNSLTGFMILSLVQYQNWLWGLQIGVFLVNFCLVLSILIIDSGYQFKPKKSLVLAAIPCIISSFTMAQGLISWLAIVPLIWVKSLGKQQKITALIYWIGLFILTCFFYFLDYPESDSEISKIAILSANPAYFLKFFLIVLGAPLAHDSPDIAFGIGLLSVVLLFGLILWGFKLYHFPFIQQIAPELSFALFALLFSGLVTLGRADVGMESGRGVDFAVESRYITNSILLFVALLQIYYTFLSKTQHKISSRSPQMIGVPILLMIFLVVNSIDSIQKATVYHQRLEGEKFCLNFIQVLDERHACWNWWEIMSLTEQMRSHTQLLNEINFIESPNIKFIDSDSNITGSLTTPELDQPLFIQQPNELLSFSGKVRLSPSFISENSSYLVALSYGNRPKIIAISSPYSLKKQPANPQTLPWNLSLSSSSLPIGETTLKAWLYHPQKQQFIRLEGEISVKHWSKEMDKNTTFNPEPTETYGFFNPSTFPALATANQRVILSGWARLPSQVQQPSRVFFSYGDEKYFLTSTEVNLDSPDVVQALGSQRYRQVGWLTPLSTWTLPPGEITIKAWVYDPKYQQLVKLENDVEVRVFPQKTTFVTQSQQVYGYINLSTISETSLTLSQRDTLSLDGWARLPDAVTQPKQVMFSYGNQKSFFAGADVNLRSPDVAKTFNSQKYNQARWKVILPIYSLPLGQTVIKAWVYHPKKQQFIQLENEVPITIVDSIKQVIE